MSGNEGPYPCCRKGNQIRPLTDNIPKCLLPVGGRPILGIWFDLCKKYGVTEVLVNLHHLSHMVEEYIKTNDFRIKIYTFYEPELLGSAGTILANRDFVKDENMFFIIYADNLTNLNLKKMADFHTKHRKVLTMGLFRTPEPSRCGIAEMDEKNIITSFVEKPSNPSSNLANAGIYVAGNELFEFIPHKGYVDFCFDVFPALTGKMCGYVIEDYIIDIGGS
ncbi:MAG: UTP--glucose-1-phosphate uridylyltransferase [candidate division WS2 bacterium]|nr:UTP--glucose-1-phosphate uridylyltransferase [Candidatus Lithacetigena glycinireducens]